MSSAAQRVWLSQRVLNAVAVDVVDVWSLELSGVGRPIGIFLLVTRKLGARPRVPHVSISCWCSSSSLV